MTGVRTAESHRSGGDQWHGFHRQKEVAAAIVRFHHREVHRLVVRILDQLDDQIAHPRPDRVMLHLRGVRRRADSGNWSLPGGTMNLGETLGGAVVRETREETGLDVELTAFSASTPTPVMSSRTGTGRYGRSSWWSSPPRAVGGEQAVSDESTNVRLVDPAELDALPIHESVRLRLRHHLERRDHPFIG
jgi:8-oxo-dGTP pyrophosphatase MutT (NUDIX family)